MESLDYWRLCQELTIVQAALLIVDHDPSSDAFYVENWNSEDRPKGYEAAKNAVTRAVQSRQIEGKILTLDIQYYAAGNAPDESDVVDVRNSWVSVDSLRKWLSARGFTNGFFFPKGGDEPDYLDPFNPRYAPKLAAAIRAWRATASDGLLSGKSPKQILMKWLREHAAEFGLADEDGKPNETGIEEVAKVANWRPTGGAPKTPS